MRRLSDIGIQGVESRDTFRPVLAPAADWQDEVDRSQGAALREIVWSLAGWIGFVVAVQLLLHALHIG